MAAASEYFEDRLHGDTFLESDEETQQAALMTATARIDLEPFVGCVTSSTQRLQWPRVGAYNRNGVLLASDTIPQLIHDATCELALVVLVDPEALSGNADLAAFQNLRLGSLDITPRHAATSALPSQVFRLLAPLREGGYMTKVSRA